jgi:membrane-bound lytic murein transglycosylase B
MSQKVSQKMSQKMSQKRLTTWQKATALVPLALLSGAWTTSLAMSSTASASPQDATSTLPDGTIVPDQAIEAPASMSRPGSIAPGVPAGAADRVIESASANGIPAAALAAYQRAEQVINAADESCNLTWQLVAAIGRVESDHGRYGGNVLGEDGRSRPGIYGIPLDGSDGTAEIRDSDAGQLDDDQVYDRAVGPMQFIPTTWSIVGVDGDGDGERDPQDIDDAALASAVYLCSGDEDLATYGGQKAAVYRYNHSQEYVDLVISVMNAYLEGDYSSIPNGVATATVLSPGHGDAVFTAGTTGKQKPAAGAGRAEARNGGGNGTRTGAGRSGTSGDSGASDGRGDDAPTLPPADDEPTSSPIDGVQKTVEDTVEETTEKVTEGTPKVTAPAEEVTGKLTDPVDQATGGTLTKSEATAKCVAQGLLAGTPTFNQCVANVTG